MNEYLDYFYETLLEVLPLAALAISVLLVIVLFIIPLIIRLGKRIELSFKNHKWMPRWLYRELEALLSLTPIVELFAPFEQHKRNFEPGEKRPHRPARFSQFPRASKTAYRVHKQTRHGFFDAPAQVRTASRAIQLRQLTDDEARVIPQYSDKEHYAIIFNFGGLAKKDLEKIYPKIKSQLGLIELEEISDSSKTVTLRASKVKVDDILTAHKNTGSWFKDHPPKSPYSLPLAVAANGEIWKFPLHHTLISGLTGSGKSSPELAIITQLVPFWEQGLVRFYGIDPKNSDLKAFGASRIFEKYASDTETAMNVIAEVFELMNARSAASGIDWDNENTNRTLEPSTKHPITILVIDEILSLLLDLKGMGKAGDRTKKQLEQITAKGRSINVFLICATQGNQIELFGSIRGNCANKIVLRQESSYFVEEFLGKGAIEKGFDVTQLPASTKANGYRYAGIAYVRGDDGGDPIKVRFPFTTDQDIIALTKPHRRAQPMSLDNLLNDGSDLFTLI